MIQSVFTTLQRSTSGTSVFLLRSTQGSRALFLSRTSTPRAFLTKSCNGFTSDKAGVQGCTIGRYPKIDLRGPLPVKSDHFKLLRQRTGFIVENVFFGFVSLSSQLFHIVWTIGPFANHRNKFQKNVYQQNDSVFMSESKKRRKWDICGG